MVLALYVIAAATDNIAVLYISRIMATIHAHLSTGGLASPYRGLPKLYASSTVNASLIEPILSLPDRITQVSSAHPEQPARAGIAPLSPPRTWNALPAQAPPTRGPPACAPSPSSSRSTLGRSAASSSS